MPASTSLANVAKHVPATTKIGSAHATMVRRTETRRAVHARCRSVLRRGHGVSVEAKARVVTPEPEHALFLRPERVRRTTGRENPGVKSGPRHVLPPTRLLRPKNAGFEANRWLGLPGSKSSAATASLRPKMRRVAPPHDRYGLPTKVVTLCAATVAVKFAAVTVMGVCAAKLFVASVT